MKILFVCTGNTCRSPMAEGIFNLLAVKENCNARAFSRGIAVYTAQSASSFAIAAAKQYGADITTHCAKQIKLQDIAESDLIFTMTVAHADCLKKAFPDYTEKIMPLSSLPGCFQISDPYGKSIEQYSECACQIYQATKQIIKMISGAKS